MQMMDGQPAPYYDKVPLRFADGDESIFRGVGARVVPGATVRRGAHLGRDVVLMPSFVNIGAYVGAVTMDGTGATVASCAPDGRNGNLTGVAGYVGETGKGWGRGGGCE